MIAVRGRFYDGRTSARIDAECRVYDNGAVQVSARDDGRLLLRRPRFDAAASPRLANTPRAIRFPDGEMFETSDQAGVDEVLRRLRRRRQLYLVHVLESRWRYILFCLAAVAAILWSAGRYGVPLAARVIARNLPATVAAQAGRHTLEALDRSVFAPSGLEPETRDRLLARFQPLLDDRRELGLQVQFRKGGRLGANAFALPGGVVVLTDEMVGLAAADEELLAVLAHEAGHVAYRHGIQRVIQDSLLAFTVMAVTGDATGTSQLFLGLPVMLTEMAYSRDFEREADRYALDYLAAREIPGRHFAELMRRLRPPATGSGGSWSNYLSTHPDTAERLRQFESGG
jgi:Zn-dependent protease with chaperone function